MTGGGEASERGMRESTRPETGAEQWADKFWDINKDLGKATSGGVPLKPFEKRVAEAERLAEEVLAAVGTNADEGIKSEAAVSYDYARSRNLPAPKLRELLDGFISETPQT